VTVELLSRDLVRTVDSIGLPSAPHPVEGRAARQDAYTIHVTTSLRDTAGRLIELVGGAKVAILTDRNVMDLYGPTLVRALEGAGIEPEVAVIPPGERHKTLGQASKLLDWLTETQIGRRDVIVTLGGGVVIDMGGWVASAYMRGVPYINVPTTLIGQVDAGIGGGRCDEDDHDDRRGVGMVEGLELPQTGSGKGDARRPGQHELARARPHGPQRKHREAERHGSHEQPGAE